MGQGGDDHPRRLCEASLASLNMRDHDSCDEDAASITSATSDTSSHYSSISRDDPPPIHAYGHTYHGSGRLVSPNDASEAHRMALQHNLFKLCLDGELVDAKLDITPGRPFEILEVGAGSGLWACEMASRHPEVNILSIDLSSALLPEDVPPNVTFEIADAMEPWPDRCYDFIHMRNLVGGGIRDWAALASAAFEHLRPGGRLEFTELRPRFFDVDPARAHLPDGRTPQIGAGCLEFERVFGATSASLGLDFDPTPTVRERLVHIGAQEVRERADWVPVKSWGDDLIERRKGAALEELLEHGMENWTLMMFGQCGWEEADTRALMEKVKQEVRDPMLRSCVNVTFITARKPLEETEIV